MTKAGGSQAHIKALDAVRGIASLVVALSHSLLVYLEAGNPSARTRSLLKLIEVGHPAVILFFVLSGFVLYLSYTNRMGDTYLSYLTRRAFRLYPAVFVAILAAAFLHWLVPGGRWVSLLGPWAQYNWDYDVTPLLIIRNMSLIGLSRSDIYLNSVCWSLVLEVRFSLLLILAVALCRKTKMGLLVVAVACFAVGYLLTRLEIKHSSLVGSALVPVASTLLFLPAFLLGVLTSDIMIKRSGERLWPTSPGLRVAIVVFALLIGRVLNQDLIWTIAFAFVVFVVCLGEPLRTALCRRPLLWLGKVSYSLYLVHLPILMALAFWLAPAVGIMVPILLAPVLSLMAAELMYNHIEKPGMAYGKLVADAISARRRASPSPSKAPETATSD